ncbi:UBC-like protein [Eremomyces bilateralis CBS 781.70]|uniref:UBC-like protein n=1 Tax=Eremomyces bilateralis CBS 781.70 TaxID=1392243 RepID=A0A6G1GBK0_9PEZI|nr:UBC-like protein [Eremomyces bilateralis CBS 781.70]KAF1815352.1 UBC-like protein [Eremomyces bilateralis CBS 781.70]
MKKLLKFKSMPLIRKDGPAKEKDSNQTDIEALDRHMFMQKARTRLKKELETIAKDPFETWSIGPVADDPFHCQGTLLGPPGSPYSEGLFFLYIRFPADYPFSAPCVYFTTRIYHPNISLNGTITLELIKDNWSVGCKIPSIFVALNQLLLEPNLATAINREAENKYKTDRLQYHQMAIEWTRSYASG